MNEALFLNAIYVLASTTFGAMGVLIIKKISSRIEATLLGTSAGIMIAAAVLSLALPALEMERLAWSSDTWGSLSTILFIILGAVFVDLLHRWLPHEHFVKGRDNQVSPEKWNRIFLIIFAIGIHNLPEGLAVGVGAASGDQQLSSTLTLAICLQNIPEGLIVAFGIRSLGFSNSKAILIGAFTGVLESFGVFVGFLAIHFVSQLLAFSLAACAGAMLYVTSQEVIPESHQPGYEKRATFALLIGFSLVLFLS